MRKKVVVLLFAALIMVQITVPVSMIVKREVTLKNGKSFRFKTAPVDPYDAFRGRYVALRGEVNKVNKPPGMVVKPGKKVYAQLCVDTDGFAKVSQILLQKPTEGDYLIAAVSYPIGNEVVLYFPIDRYYMEESAAPRAERVYWEHSQREKKDAYVTVKIKEGLAVIEGLYIGDKRIEEILQKHS